MTKERMLKEEQEIELKINSGEEVEITKAIEILSLLKENISLEEINTKTGISISKIEEIRVKYLGKKGELTGILKQLGSLSPEERPIMGQLVNQAKQELEELISEKKSILAAKAQEEIDGAKAAIKLLGGKIIEEKSFRLSDGGERNIIIIKKISHVPPKYPRVSAQIAKKPL